MPGQRWKLLTAAFLLGVILWAVAVSMGHSLVQQHEALILLFAPLVLPGFLVSFPLGGHHSDLPWYFPYLIAPVSNGVAYALLFLFLRWLRERSKMSRTRNQTASN